jgi:hypothetical protein
MVGVRPMTRFGGFDNSGVRLGKPLLHAFYPIM